MAADQIHVDEIARQVELSLRDAETRAERRRLSAILLAVQRASANTSALRGAIAANQRARDRLGG
jgi:hypothetical protein